MLSVNFNKYEKKIYGEEILLEINEIKFNFILFFFCFHYFLMEDSDLQKKISLIVSKKVDKRK